MSGENPDRSAVAADDETQTQSRETNQTGTQTQSGTGSSADGYAKRGTASPSWDDYLPQSVAGGVGGFIAGLFVTTGVLEYVGFGEFEQSGGGAIMYLWFHFIVPYQSTVEKLDGATILDLNPIGIFFTFIFGFVLILTGYAVGRSVDLETAGEDQKPRLLAGGIALGYAVSAYVAADTYVLEENVDSALFYMPDTVSISVDPTMAAVAGLLFGGAYAYVGTSAAEQPLEDRKRAIGAFAAGWVLLIAFLNLIV